MRIAGLVAAALVALTAGAANAQPPADDTQRAPVPIVAEPAVPTTAFVATTVPSDVTAPASSSVTYEAGNTTLTNTMVTNGPVADTPENRAKYGQPMSQAGKRTSAKGN